MTLSSYHGRQYLAARKAKGRTTLTRFAEALAETGSVPQSAHLAGICEQRGYQLFARMRRELGDQAR